MLVARCGKTHAMAGEIRFFELGVEGDAEQVARTGRFELCRDDQGSPFGLHEPPRGG